MYSAYIDNFLNAKDAVRTAKEAKPAFHKFLEVSVIIKSWLSSEGRTFWLCIKEVIIVDFLLRCWLQLNTDKGSAAVPLRRLVV